MCHERTCHNVSARFDLVESKLLQIIEQWIGQYAVSAKQKKPDTTVLDSKEALLSDAEHQILEERGKLSKIYDSYEKGIYDTNVFLERQKLANSKILEAEKRVAFLKEEIEQERLLLANETRIIPKAKKLLEIYRTSDDAELKNQLMKEVVEKVVYTKTANGHFKNQRQDDFQLDLYPKIPKDFPL